MFLTGTEMEAKAREILKKFIEEKHLLQELRSETQDLLHKALNREGVRFFNPSLDPLDSGIYFVYMSSSKGPRLARIRMNGEFNNIPLDVAEEVTFSE